jgi:uncharacterized membrane protein YhaH (DUF805 family)
MNIASLVGFEGRIGRSTWWLGFIFASTLYVIQSMMFGFNFMAPDGANLGLASLALLAASFLVSLFTTVKRYHDRGKSGWWFLLVFVPIIGSIWQFIECGFCRGDDGDNDYGPVPGSDDDVVATAKSSGGGGKGSRLDKLDDDYFKNYMANAAAQPAAMPAAQRPAAAASSPPAFGGGKPAFGKR